MEKTGQSPLPHDASATAKAGTWLLWHRLNLGDLVLAAPALAQFKAIHPDIRLVLATNDLASHVAARMKAIDELMVYRKFENVGVPEWRVTAILRMRQFDRVVALCPWPDKRLALRCLLFRNTRGYAVPGAWWSSAYTEKIGVEDRPRHVTDRIAALMGVSNGLCCSGTELRPVGEERGRYDVCIHANARKPSNRPNADQLARMVRLLLRKDRQLKIVVTSPPEDTRFQAHAGNAGHHAGLRAELGGFPLALRLGVGLEENLGLIEQSRTTIQPDGGLMHFAVGLGKPTVALFGNAPLEVWEPRARHAVCLRAGSRQVGEIDPEAIVDAWVELSRGRGQ